MLGMQLASRTPWRLGSRSYLRRKWFGSSVVKLVATKPEHDLNDAQQRGAIDFGGNQNNLICDEQLISLKNKMVEELQELRLAEMRIRDDHADSRQREERAAIDHVIQEHRKDITELKDLIRAESRDVLKILSRRTLYMLLGCSLAVAASTMLSIQVVVNGGGSI